jgi:two-component system cell cycle sensor histidine kinase PleC
MIEGKARDAQINLTFTMNNEALQMVADRRAVMQILLNLLSNAVKFTKPGGWVRILCEEQEKFVTIKVQDNGIGIPSCKLGSITNPFEQVANHYTREHEGTGLGLAITKDLVELHGGNLHIASTVDVGTTVSVRLPYDSYAFKKEQHKKSAAV